MTTKELGDLGENMACEYLVKKGFKILGRNYRITFGEIDIIAKKEKVIHFVEVKTLEAGSGFSPEEHVDYRKQHKLRDMAQIWLSKNRYSEETACQIDVIGITADYVTRKAQLRYFPNAVPG